jgi:GTPase SAR1 family protein
MTEIRVSLNSHVSSDYLFKFLIVGAYGAGKTCLFKRIAGDISEWSDEYKSTRPGLGTRSLSEFVRGSHRSGDIEFRLRIVKADANTVKLQVWVCFLGLIDSL